MCIHVLKLINFFFSKMLRLIFPGNMISFFGSVIISCVSNTIHRMMIYNIYVYFHSTRLDAIIHNRLHYKNVNFHFSTVYYIFAEI